MFGALRDAGVNLIASWGYPHGTGRPRLGFVPENGATFIAAAKQLKLTRKHTAFYIRGDYRPGAVVGRIFLLTLCCTLALTSGRAHKSARRDEECESQSFWHSC